MDKLIYIDKVKTNTDQFAQKVSKIADVLGINPNWLMLVMYAESRLNHKAVNPKGGATGLIQFMPQTAKNLGTSTDQLKNMSNVDQLDYVYKFFLPYKGKIKSYTDLYTITFFPIALGKGDNYIFKTKSLSADTIAKQNPAIAKFSKGNYIDNEAFRNYVNSTIPKSILKQLPSTTISIIPLAIVAISLYLLFR